MSRQTLQPALLSVITLCTNHLVVLGWRLIPQCGFSSPCEMHPASCFTNPTNSVPRSSTRFPPILHLSVCFLGLWHIDSCLSLEPSSQAAWISLQLPPFPAMLPECSQHSMSSDAPKVLSGYHHQLSHATSSVSCYRLIFQFLLWKSLGATAGH